MKRIVAVFLMLAACVAAAPVGQHPLQLVVPAPAEALRLAHYKTYPDESVVDKVKNLERVARAANPKAKPRTVYLTPEAATIPIRGWKEDLNRHDTPLPEASLGQCLDWLCRRVPTLEYTVVGDKILIYVKQEKLHNKAIDSDKK